MDVQGSTETAPEGLELYADLLSAAEAAALLETVDALSAWESKIGRRTMQFGYGYDYASKSANVKLGPIPDALDWLVQRLLDKRVLQMRPDQCIINEYLPGQGIGMHTDNVNYFADGIVSVSLGAPVVMQFSPSRPPAGGTRGGREGGKYELTLPVGSALALRGPARWQWQHGIVARKSDGGVRRKRRVSITFRKMN